jgi:hypothetical protein
MANFAKRVLDYTEVNLKLKAFFKKVSFIFFSMFRKIPSFTWQIIPKEDFLNYSFAYQKMLQYELINRTTQIIRINSEVPTWKINLIFMKMGFNVDMVWGSFKHCDMMAVRDLNYPFLYGLFYRLVWWLFINLPLPKFQLLLPGFGKRRHHLRFFQDKDNDCWYVTSHVDETNPLSLSIKDKKEMYQSHFLNKIEGDYKEGEELLIALLERYFGYNKL